MKILSSDLQNTIEFATKLSALLQEYKASVRYAAVAAPPLVNCEGSNYDLILCHSREGEINIMEGAKDEGELVGSWIGTLQNGKDFSPHDEKVITKECADDC